MPVLTSLTDTETALLLIPEDEIVLSIAAASVFVWIAVNEISANKTVNKYPFRLLQANEFLRVSLDTSCQKIEDGVCSNYNYLVFYDFDYWLITPSPEKTYNTYVLSDGIYNCVSSAIIFMYMMKKFCADAAVICWKRLTAESAPVFPSRQIPISHC